MESIGSHAPPHHRLVDAILAQQQTHETRPNRLLVTALDHSDLMLPAPLDRRPSPGARTFDVITTAENGQKVLLAFTDTDALTAWSRRPIGFLKMSAWAVLETALSDEFEGVLLNACGPARHLLDGSLCRALLAERSPKARRTRAPSERD